MNTLNRTMVFTVLVGALGYFVDIYDLLLFGIVRIPSLRAIGVPESEMMNVGFHLLDMQMLGLLTGGIVWGITGDKRGRKSVMFGSILLYSLCNIANAFVRDVNTYAWLRFFAGIGLAGELGCAITLVAEVMPKETRGYGTSIVAGVGILGAVVGALIGDFFSWHTAYLVGGGLGLGLLVLRAGVMESGMFKAAVLSDVGRGQFYKLFFDWRTFRRYASCILIGVPIWFVIGILVTFSPEITKAMGVTGAVTAPNAIMWSYAGLAAGDLAAGAISQWLRSRRKTVLCYLVVTASLILFYVNAPVMSPASFYTLCAALGLATGYWATFITIGAEQFGTNIRATVATTIPNFVRGSVVPMTFGFRFFQSHLGMLNSALAVGGIVIAAAFVSLFFIHETFDKSLDYHEAL